MSDLKARLLAAHRTAHGVGGRTAHRTAHRAGDKVGDKSALVALYSAAACGAATQDQAAFFLTNAYIYALEMAHADAPVLRARLVAMGRETAGD